jgi:hypothetical protein
MQKIETVNNVTHENLKVNASYSAELGDNVASTITFMNEFSEVQKEYPILCRKAPETGELQAVVFFGFEKNENLFLAVADPVCQKNVGWRAEYVPAAMARGPFSIGVPRNADNGGEEQKPVVHIDMEHPKANCSDGQRLFLQNGGHSPYLNYIATALDTINDGMYLTKLMFDAFNECSLLEPVTLDIEFVNKDKLNISGFETINTEALSRLSGDEMERLNKLGFLQSAFFMASSMSNFQKLIDWKNRKISASGGAS